MELVNEAIIECKVTLDPLTAANFDDPPRTILYKNFKRWINNAYHEVLLQRQEWYFRKERAVVDLWPRLFVHYNGTLPMVGDRLKSDKTGAEFTVVKVHTFENNEMDPIGQVTISVEFDEGYDTQNLYLNDTFSQTFPVELPSVATLKGLGRYNFKDDVFGLAEIDKRSFRAFLKDDDLDNSGRKGTPLAVVPYYKWPYALANQPFVASGTVQSITEAPDGNYEIHPQPQEGFTLSFDFTRDFVPMVEFDDTPVGVPEKYQGILVWKAAQEFADYDNNANIFSRAKKKLEMYDYWLHRDEMPTPHIGGNLFYKGY